MWLDLSPIANEPLMKMKLRNKTMAMIYGERIEKKWRGQEVITEITIFIRPAFIPVEKEGKNNFKNFKSSYETHDHDFYIVQMLQHIPSLHYCCPVGVHILEYKLLR